MTNDDLEADCSACFALCCVALGFSRSEGFGHDKAQGEPCHFLARDFGCRIHARREALGYEGCIEFDCLGAGQRASRQFAAENWRSEPAVARQMYAAFARLLQIQEMRKALNEAVELDLDIGQQRELDWLMQALADAADRSDDAGEAALLQQAKNWLAQLSGYAG